MRLDVLLVELPFMLIGGLFCCDGWWVGFLSVCWAVDFGYFLFSLVLLFVCGLGGGVWFSLVCPFSWCVGVGF